MKKIFSVFLLTFLFLLFNFSYTYAWFGAGVTSGWSNTSDGLKGRVVAPLYKATPQVYAPNETITVNFEIENPNVNTSEVNKPLYLKVYKVTHSPIDRDLTIPTALALPITESELYANNAGGNDYQFFFSAFSVGQLVLAPGETSNFTQNFAINQEGYYQFDLSDLESNGFIPGHIYAAGFVKVYMVQETQGESTNSGNSGNTSSSSTNSSNTSSGGSILGAATQLTKVFKGANQSTESKEPVEEIEESEIVPEILGKSDEVRIARNCITCIWIAPLIGIVLISALITIFTHKKFTTSAKVLIQLVILNLGYLIFLLLNKDCRNLVYIVSDAWQCRYFFFIAGGLLVITSSILNKLLSFFKKK